MNTFVITITKVTVAETPIEALSNIDFELWDKEQPTATVLDTFTGKRYAVSNDGYNHAAVVEIK